MTIWTIVSLGLLVPAGVVLSTELLKWWRSRQRPATAANASPSSCPGPLRLKQLLAGGLPQHEQALKAHLDSCEHCQRAVDQLVADHDSWSGVAKHLGQESSKPELALGKVMEKLKDEVVAGATCDEHKPGEAPSLDFLSPSTQPGHLGCLGHYEVLEVIGRGGMGVVLKAFDPSLHRVVAIKVLAPQLASSGTARKRFTREAQAAAAVSHDHVVTIHAVAEANGLPYLVMQYIAGRSLQERLDKGGPLELKEILRIGMQAAAGLAAAHAQGLVHRDIKPANILLENGIQRVKITDFGLARAADDASLTQSGVVAGTPQYMAPEQTRGETVDRRADLFSLGSVLYAMCTGRPPFCASTTMAVLRRVSDETPRSIKELNPEIPSWLVAIVEKLHAKDPADRFQNAKEVAELLNQHLAQLQQASWTPIPDALPDESPQPAPDAEGPITSLTICPSCGGHLHVPDKMVGQVVNCPQCSKPFQVEDTSQEIEVLQIGKPEVVPPAKRKRRFRRWPWVAGGVFLFLLFTVCGGLGLLMVASIHSMRSTPVTMPVSPRSLPSSAAAKARLEAAGAINDFQQRDAAFAQIAVDAAAGSDVVTVQEALRRMFHMDERDKTAATCALALAKYGKYREATTIAKGIHNFSQRDAVLSKLAKGEFGR